MSEWPRTTPAQPSDDDLLRAILDATGWRVHGDCLHLTSQYIYATP